MTPNPKVASVRKVVVPAAMFAVALVLLALLSLPKRVPGYMDAYYHTVVAERIAGGQGLTEPFVWNFLDAPTTIPHASNLYWMPLPAFLAAGAMKVFGLSYRAATIPFIFGGALLALMTYWIARKIGTTELEAAISGLLIVAAGFYAAYWSSPDSFVPFALAGALCLYLLSDAERSGWRAAFAGIFAGLGHLARPDGVLLLVTGLIVLAWRGIHHTSRDIMEPRREWRAVGLLCAGYLVVMLPWFVRNWVAVGSPFAGSGLQTLFLRSYDEIYAAANLPSLSGYLSWGLGNIVSSKISASLSNLATLAGALMFALAPLSVWGWWKHRRSPLALPFATFGGLLYLAMGLAFTFPGIRGSFFHSAGALLPFLFASVFPGLKSAVAWFSARRKTWNPVQASRFFSVSLLVLSLAVSGVLYVRTILGSPPATSGWNDGDKVYPEVAAWLEYNGSQSDRFMVNNAPAFYYFTRLQCVSIPSDGFDGLSLVTQRYGIQWLLLEYNHPAFLDDAYNNVGAIPGWVPRYIFFDSAGLKAILYESQE